MKAWATYCGDDWSILIWADKRSRAITLGMREGFDESEYSYWRATRRPEYDKYCDTEEVVTTNDELPPGAPSFYNDEMI